MERKEKALRNNSVLEIVQVGLMAAIVFIATSMIHFQTFMGVMHAGDSMVFLSAILLGKKKAAIASAIGMALFDLAHGYMTWAPFTFIIKGVMAYIAAILAYKSGLEGEKVGNNILAFITAGIFMIVAYYLGGAIILSLLQADKQPFTQALILSAKDIPTNIAQVVIGILIAVPLLGALKKAGIKNLL
ncbi:ECF transporter S component [Clostridium swellfunianum]|uniref:ECF transporter S component n=1 Tax=Clostridium swellfunianum TaxID=1367462 RepID=UPI00202EBE34|nr:ECF transporter S component [Clostridium swellfunianum]MCM0650790.1 ECF transporter S component [Clostridium swellfunianum]